MDQYSKRLEQLFKRFDLIAGIDEVGRGPLAGPVVSAVLCLEKSDLGILDQLGLKDSKKLIPKKREKIYHSLVEFFEIKQKIGIGMASVETIDRINILQASFLAMKRAVSNLNPKYRPKFLMTDGRFLIPNLSISQKAYIKGDDKFSIISAASIIAKVFRDRMLEKLHQKFPNYLFDKNKGYGTKAHLEALKKFGPCEIHRKSFGPVKKLI
jgi:ribonuclease HII